VVSCDVVGPHARLTLERPPHNRISGQVLRELGTHLDVLEQRADIHVVTVHSTPGSPFSLGADVGELVRAQPAGRTEFVRLTQQTFNKLASLPQLSIAVLEGSAIGGGFELALACDVRVASRGAHRFGLPELSVGLLPAGGGMKRLVRLVGLHQAKFLIASASLMDPEGALRAGLLHVVGTRDRPWESELAELLERFTSTDGLAVRALKGVLASWDEAVGPDWNQGELDAIVPLLHRPDLEELLAPFV
jgi:enoyl-CoA hydratase/carnithine racemase